MSEGWYKVDYTKAEPLSFGFGAGCDFVEQDCIDRTSGELLPSSRGFFCTNDNFDSCTADHTAKSFCNLMIYDNIPEEYQYFPDTPNLGGYPSQSDFCPTPNANILACDAGFSCFEREDNNSVCLEFGCNEADYRVEFSGPDGSTYACENDFDVIEVALLGQVVCPRITQVCPRLGCDALCSGRGECDWSARIPSCICYDRGDETSGCYGFVEQLRANNLGDTVKDLEESPTLSPSTKAPTQSPAQVPTTNPTQAPVASRPSPFPLEPLPTGASNPKPPTPFPTSELQPSTASPTKGGKKDSKNKMKREDELESTNPPRGSGGRGGKFKSKKGD